MKQEQKYMGEVALLQATKGVALIKPAELPAISTSPQVQELADAHIYFVCQRPRVRLARCGSRTSEGIRFTLNVADKNGMRSKDFLIPHESLPQEVAAIEPEQDGAYVVAIDDQKRGLTPLMPLEKLLPFTGYQLAEFGNLEVVYVGQSFGDGGSRSAVDRLQSHSTLQRVLADLAQESWWVEPVLLLFTYDSPQLITRIDGQGSPEITGDEDFAHYMSLRDQPLSDAQAVSIAEASLIRYFEPHYNTHFKGNYPTSNLQHLRDAYRLDYNAIITEIDTEDLYFKTFSQKQSAAVHHIAQFDLHDPKERFSFFEIKPSSNTRRSGSRAAQVRKNKPC